MAALPSPTQVAGSHTAIYEAYYNQVDPNGYGRIGAMEAARFLKKSQLSDVILSKIWDMADPQSRGSLDKSGLFVALKLCALAQAGRDLNMSNLNIELPPPKMGDIPIISQKNVINTLPVITSVNNGDWSIKPSERAKYDQLFDSLQPSNGYIPGNKVKDVLMDSKLPLDTLGKIWDLADMDKDGMLDRHEFVVAVHLVYKALEKYAIPSVLPPELMPPGKRKDSTAPISKSPAPMSVITTVPPPIPPLPNVSSMKNMTGLDITKINMQWVISSEDQIAADKLFLQADLDMDGYVSGIEIKDVFLQSGLPQTVLAHIWSLCDTCQSGKLNKEQFALAMWLIKQKLRGIEPPATLSPDMVPPSMRKPSESIVENNNISGYSNPELDMISKDIAELVKERQSMEQDIAQKEADIKIKNGEIKSLQSELDTLAATLKQLENQKGEAQKRLNDLKAQVDKLRQQAEEQESVLRTQEEELNFKRQELEGLRQEEQQLEQQQNKSRDQLNELTKNLQDTQLQICQAKAKITHLQEQQRQMSDAIALYDSALAAGDATLVPDTSLQFNPEIENLEYEKTNEEDKIQNKKNVSFSKTNEKTLDGFEQDPFAEAFNVSTPDPFGNAFSSPSITGGFTADPFSVFDDNNIAKQDPFDPFGDGKRTDTKTTSTTATTKDPFGDDPFANLHAPPRPESPSPALPPKKAKQPPPRPAPPRPAQGPTGPLRAAPAPPTPSPTPDPFANAFSTQQGIMDNNNSNNFNTSTGFADFANFDSKPEPTLNRTAPPRPTSRTHTVSTVTSKLPDFTEDPFRDYRYEDLFNIADPFADDTEDFNANKNETTAGNADPFSYGTISALSRKNSFTKSFDTDFSNTLSFTKNKIDKDNAKFDTDFVKAFSDDNRNIKTIESDAFSNIKIKTIDIDEAFSTKNEKSTRRHGQDLAHNKSKSFSFNDKKSKSEIGKIWNGNNTPLTLSEEEQFVWASQQSLKTEEERRRRKKQEEAELALALELSKQDKSGKL
ncbi:epidermal growth factor receptor substrate 15-like 1 isoform X2 [Apis mellifera]|uniref:Epidermal growth factor receptor substrate 15-like 1 isoform X2 n=1 Tax=Apis mellifera TaxID=7460 RepID=A0A7M7MKR7_APIME|nr:epidermal growth factor receptor substrate 15-like 1 isoform X2 [Apis mellifera]|eukprot:XP_026297437.1 epidermal growth factor receptor substrate 15-like 1 isoform X2 [Apis mellifera]